MNDPAQTAKWKEIHTQPSNWRTSRRGFGASGPRACAVATTDIYAGPDGGAAPL